MKKSNYILGKYVSILSEYYGKDIIDDILRKWNEPHRYYHNTEHLLDILKRIDDFFLTEEIGYLYMSDTYKNFIIAAFFHDVIYDPKSQSTNEDRSIEYFLGVSSKLSEDNRKTVVGMIECTKYRKIPEIDPNSHDIQINRKFWYFDNAILWDNTIDGLIEYENKVFKEYQFVDYGVYVSQRTDFLKKQIELFNIPDVTRDLSFLINYIKNRKIRVGLYTGSFNPFHLGHLDILQKASLVFDKVIVAYGNNPEKSTRTITIPQSLNYYQVDTYSGLVTNYITSVENDKVDVTLVRGLRNGADLDYEANQLAFINDIKPDVKVVYIPCDKQYEHISSSAIRDLKKFDIELASKYTVK